MVDLLILQPGGQLILHRGPSVLVMVRLLLPHGHLQHLQQKLAAAAAMRHQQHQQQQLQGGLAFGAAGVGLLGGGGQNGALGGLTAMHGAAHGWLCKFTCWMVFVSYTAAAQWRAWMLLISSFMWQAHCMQNLSAFLVPCKRSCMVVEVPAVRVIGFHAGLQGASQASAASICGLGGASGDRFDVHLQLGASQVPLRVRLGTWAARGPSVCWMTHTHLMQQLDGEMSSL